MSDKDKLPLAVRMRPVDFREFIGQEGIVGEGRLLRKAIESDNLSSIIFYGPPGTGKTTLAKIIAKKTQAKFRQINAVTSGVKDIRAVIEEARNNKEAFSLNTILFIDEIHRFNKSQQDALLPSVEDGTIILIGATTENPFFEVNPPLVSRSRIFQLKKLEDEDIEKIITNAINDPDRGLGKIKVKLDEDAFAHIVNVANGDARSALNALEMAVNTTREEKGVCHITLGVAEESIQKRALQYDKGGDNHYDTISAFIKSMRGGDPDATVYWLAKMLHAGEDPKFIARRIIIQAAEDVGNADPHTLLVAVAAARAVEFVGMPEAKIPLAQAATYLACSPKSNAAYKAISAALEDIEKERTGDVPVHLKDASYKGASRFGHGKGYKYPHDYPGNYVPQSYLPKYLQGKTYYNPSGNGYEKTIAKRLKVWKKQK